MDYAGVAHRFVALLIDGVLFFALGLFMGLATGGGYSTRSGGTHEFGVQAGTRATLATLFLFFAYYVIAEAVFGQTLGKRVAGLRVVDEEGYQIGLGAALVRNLLRLVDGLFFYLVAAVSVWVSPKGQRLGDRAAHTCVVRVRSGYPAPASKTREASETRTWTARAQEGSYTQDDFMADLTRAKRWAESSPD